MSDSLLPYEADSRVQPVDPMIDPTTLPAVMPPKAPRRQARTTIALLGFAMLFELLWAVHSWIVLHYVGQLGTGHNHDLRPKLDDLHAWGRSLHLITWGLRAAVLVFLVDWMLCVRTNADSYHPGEFRHSRGWIIWGWVCPGLNFVYPYDCMSDAWSASDPKRSERLPVKATPPPALVSFWWASLVAGGVVYVISSIVGRTAHDISMRRVGVEMETLSHLLMLLAGGMLIAIVAKVTMFGRIHRRIFRAALARGQVV